MGRGLPLRALLLARRRVRAGRRRRARRRAAAPAAPPLGPHLAGARLAAVPRAARPPVQRPLRRHPGVAGSRHLPACRLPPVQLALRTHSPVVPRQPHQPRHFRRVRQPPVRPRPRLISSRLEVPRPLLQCVLRNHPGEHWRIHGEPPVLEPVL
uniref:Uncharacterized protein n=1 Tax=Zea mays TaxID=4577 RepID=C4J5R9_MAIZE|nr:unknown [Zea mays]